MRGFYKGSGGVQGPFDDFLGSMSNTPKGLQGQTEKAVQGVRIPRVKKESAQILSRARWTGHKQT